MTESGDDEDDETDTEEETVEVVAVEDVHDWSVPCNFSKRLRRLSLGDEEDSSSSESIQTAGASILLAIFFLKFLACFRVFRCKNMMKRKIR